MAPGDSTILYRRRYATLSRQPLLAFLRDLAARIPRSTVHCLIAGDDELLELNRRFRRKDYPADVLSFPSTGYGELAISYDRAKDQARERGHTIEEEVRILMLHGVLHLGGHDHERDRGEMARAERRWRQKLGLPDSLTERAAAEERSR